MRLRPAPAKETSHRVPSKSKGKGTGQIQTNPLADAVARASEMPVGLTPVDLAVLQRSLGNRATGALLAQRRRHPVNARSVVQGKGHVTVPEGNLRTGHSEAGASSGKWLNYYHPSVEVPGRSQDTFFRTTEIAATHDVAAGSPAQGKPPLFRNGARLAVDGNVAVATRGAAPILQRALQLDSSWDPGLTYSALSYVGGRDWAETKKTLINDFAELEAEVARLDGYAFKDAMRDTYALAKGFVTVTTKDSPHAYKREVYENLTRGIKEHSKALEPLAEAVAAGDVITKEQIKEQRKAQRQLEKEERARERAEQEAAEAARQAAQKQKRAEAKQAARRQRQQEREARQEAVAQQLAAARVPSGQWNNDVDDALAQLVPGTRGAVNPMNHLVNQQSVLQYLPAADGDNVWVQLRTGTSLGDNHFRVFIEIAPDGTAVPGGQVAVARGLSHHDVRSSGRFYCYSRAGRGAWQHQSGENPYQL